MSDGIEEIGTPKWDITLCLLLAWIVVFLCICKGIRSSGKVSNLGTVSLTILALRNS